MTTLAERHQISEQELAFVREVAQGSHADAEAAAVAAGYQISNAKQAANRLMQRPQILAAIAIETGRKIQAAAPAAADTIEQIRAGKISGEGAKLRLDAAKTILDRAGFIAPRAAAPTTGHEKQLDEMSIAELKATQQRLQEELANRAKPVNAPKGPVIEGQAFEILE